MRKIFLLATFLPALAGPLSLAQSPDSLLATVLEHNRVLEASRKAYQVSLSEARTGVMPPDPEVEFGYLFSNPAENGNRTDVRVTQQVDFPTSYIYRSRLGKIKSAEAELEYIRTRQEIIQKAKQLWITRIYLNQLEKLLRERIELAVRINEQFHEKLVTGEAGLLAYSHSNLQLAALQNEYEKLQAEIGSNQISLIEITGGIEVVVPDTQFPPPTVISLDSISEAYEASPGRQLMRSDLSKSIAMKKLAVSRNLPKLSGGYYSESVIDQQFRGFHLGFSIPLWENTNRIKQAALAVQYTEAEADRFAIAQESRVKDLSGQVKSLDTRIRNMEDALNAVAEPDLLLLAFESGEISLTEYFFASDFYFRNQQLLLEYRRDRLLKEAELLKVFY
jgi:cobalt-zinc-cadmium efflux system outer membrane protein